MGSARKPHVLILGANGQVGHAATAQALALRREMFSEITAVTKDQVNLANPDQIAEIVRALKPEVIINAAAYTNVEKAEDEVELALQVNGHAVGQLAELAKSLGALLVHYSTDYVFDGQSTRPYLETDALAPQSSYGRSKAKGEAFIEEVGSDAVVLRTGWVFGRHGDNFYRKIMRFAKQRAETKQALTIVDDQTGAPTPAEWLAELAIKAAVLRAEKNTVPIGLFHAAAAGQTTWFDYAELAISLAEGTKLLPASPGVERTKTHLMNFKAQRPTYSVLNTDKLQKEFKVEPPHWATAVSASVLYDVEQATQATKNIGEK
jgi:dTDP-4-dehydrorhamnose reductase